MKRSTILLFILLLFVLFGLTGGASIQAISPDGLSPAAFLPAVVKPNNVDLTISGLEITQSVQRADNSVPLVTNRATVVRVFAQTVAGTPPGGVTVSLTAVRTTTTLGSMTVGPQTVPLTPDRGLYGSTFNAVLPTGWLSGNVQLTVTVDSANAVPEVNENNNNTTTTLVFHEVPALNIKIVPITYTHNPNGHTYPGQFQDNISDWMLRTYPVHDIEISYRSPSYAFAGDLSYIDPVTHQAPYWTALLDQVTDLWYVEATPGQVYYASIPIGDGSGNWFSSGVAGIGWIGFWRTSVGLNLGAGDASGVLAGHEIGHNFGRRHAPCGGAGGIDPGYPYADAWIGEYGLDVPHTALLGPFAYKDMMSYCGPEWVSDYTYEALYNDQMANDLVASAAPTKSLMIRVTFNEAGAASIKPVYSFEMVPTAEVATGDYAVQLLDENGEVLSTHPVAPVTAEEPGVFAQAIRARIPLPETPIAAVRLVQGGKTLATRTLSPYRPAPSLTLWKTAESTILSWGTPNVPAMVRYSVDDGHTWTVLGLDVLGGQLTVDTTQLPGENGRFEVLLADS